MGSTGLGSTLVALTLVASARALAFEAATEPPSPGELALLVSRTIGTAELAQFRSALAGARADSRATAARLVRLTGNADLGLDLMNALAVETDVGAAREEMHALGAFAGTAVADALLAAAARFDGRLSGALLVSLAMRGPDALSLGPKLEKIEASGSEWETFFDWATRGGRDQLEQAVEFAHHVGVPESWRGILAFSARVHRPLADAAAARAIRSESPELRELTCWHLLKSGREQAVGSETRAAVAAAAERQPGPTGGLALELLSRSLGRPPVDQTAQLRALSSTAARKLPVDDALLESLSPAEREALAAARPDDRKGDAVRRTAPTPAAGDFMRDKRFRTASDFPDGVVNDVLDRSGCQLPRDPGWAGLEVRFDGTGTLSRILTLKATGPASCELAARTLLLLTVQPTDHPPSPNSTHVILLPLAREFAACITAPRPVARPARVGPNEVQPPRKVKSVLPRFPQDALLERRSGVIIVEAVIAPQGCIRSGEVLSGDYVDLAAEALRTVVQWAYTPTLLNGVPVPVIMTVTVNFKLQ